MIPNDELLRFDIVSDVHVLMEELIPKNYDEWFKERSIRKIVHDALWGTFELMPHEVALLDTPLFQRLRFVHQTGAVNFTYPSARHSRFEHVLGVMYQSTKMCHALRSRPNEERFGSEFERQVRFASLLHDVGHGPFSHTSEQFFSKHEDISSIKQIPYFQDSGAGEVLSALMVSSPRFREFVIALNSHYKIKIDIDLACDMITGNMPNDRMFEGEFVHGPFDADKLDYMHRDAMFSGLKLLVDLDRLYASIDVRTGRDEEGEESTRLAGSVAGVTPLTQIMFNKMLLFTAIYHHHKVRAVDCMIWAIFELAETKGGKLGGIEVNRPINFLRLTDDYVLNPLLADNEDIKDLINKIRSRDLWKRALVISRHTVEDSVIDTREDTSKCPLSEFIGLAGNRPISILRRRELAKKIWEYAEKPCKEHEVWIDIPKQPSMVESERMWINTSSDEEPLRLGKYMPIEQWVELYGHHRWKSHVFCPPDVRDSINRAAIVVLERELGLSLKRTATEQAKIKR